MTVQPGEEPREFVDRMLRAASGKGASDLYWIPSAGRLDVRIRAGGQQQSVATVPRDYGEQCVARLKVLAGLLTYRTRVAQDGAIRNAAAGCELRVSVMPTSHGERASVRLLPAAGKARALDELGFAPDVVRALRGMLARPAGLIVLTGPTGSGKTTTIYALIRDLLSGQQDPASIVTIEDPIECELDGVSQTQVAEASGWGYAAALRAALRHDVKTLVVGEMRDRDVVKVTLDAALTGHRIVTTYHAGDIPSVYGRILQQGFEPFLVASAITGVVTQRLVPRKDGAGLVPVVATLVPTDEWRDFIAAAPGLAALRTRIREWPGADLAAAAARLAREGTIGEEESQRIASDS